MKSSSKFDSGNAIGNTFIKGNPDPSNYCILRSLKIGNYLILEIKYHDCTNYEGRKVLVFNGVSLDKLLRHQKLIDPHFSSNPNFYSPIARFVPTEEGWEMAFKFAKFLEKA